MTPGSLLQRASAITLAFVPFLLLGLWLDPTQVTGVSRWLKPLKFFLSVPIFYLTVAYYLGYLASATAARRIAIGVTVCLAGENLLILMQALRAVPSHFNHSTPFDSGVFITMGVLIAINTALTAELLLHLFRNPRPASPALLWGLRAGAALAILGSLQGIVMVARNAHTVGAPDGFGPALWLTGWSTQFGDLRIAHFIGLHSFQVLPLLGYLLARAGTPRAPLLVGIAFLAYFALAALLFLQALAAKPLIF
ncbi:MAG: hypothetical protein K2Q23_12185 [Bryobacteraceae bacterium]|nr:hypothetical protein [Bryobacteraceae bacterium]